MKGLNITKKFAVWGTVTVMIVFYIFSMLVLPGLNLAVPVVIIASTGVHLILALWILLTSILPTVASVLGLEW
jgi:hypothetical protein